MSTFHMLRDEDDLSNHWKSQAEKYDDQDKVEKKAKIFEFLAIVSGLLALGFFTIGVLQPIFYYKPKLETVQELAKPN